MATSSFFHNIVIRKKKDAERFVEALEKAEQWAKEENKMEDKTWVNGEYYETPFKARKMIQHKGRFFAIDEENRIQWTAKNGTFVWYQERKDDKSYEQQDAGWWEITGKKIVNIRSEAEGVVVTTDGGREYVLVGDSYDTFNMTERY